MPRQKTAISLRVSDETITLVEAIREVREGLSATRVYENAVELYARQVLGRRAADLAPVRRRAGRTDDRR